MVQLIIVARRKSLRHRLNALAIAGTDQPRHIKRTHLSTRFVTQLLQERRQPLPQLGVPILDPRHDRRSDSAESKLQTQILNASLICQGSASYRGEPPEHGFLRLAR